MRTGNGCDRSSTLAQEATQQALGPRLGLAAVAFGILAGRSPNASIARRNRSTRWLLVAAVVVAGACGARVNKLLRYFSDLEFDADFERLSRHPQLARRILILIMSVGVFVLAIQRLLSH